MRAGSAILGQRAWLGMSLLALAGSLPSPAEAQASASASLQSDYRWRGVSLSEGRPAVSLDLAYDHNSGLYFGGSAIGTTGPSQDARFLGHIEYIGYALRRVDAPSWDIGAINSNLTYYYGKGYPLRYTEFYAGIIGNNISSHLYFSPNYLKTGTNTLYADIDGALRIGSQWRVFGRVGALTPLGGGGSDGGRERYDVRAGIVRQFRNCEIQLTWTALAPQPPHPSDSSRPAVVAAISYFF